MTKFEMIGIQAQQNAVTKEEARRAFKWSCNCCCNRGMRIERDRCQIAMVHEQTIACIDTMEQVDIEIAKKKVAASELATTTA